MHRAYSLKHSKCSDQQRGREREGSRRAGDSLVHHGTAMGSNPWQGEAGTLKHPLDPDVKHNPKMLPTPTPQEPKARPVSLKTLP